MIESEERPPVKALFAQLASDTSRFAQAEMAWLREQAGERWNYALPALIGIGIGIALLLSVAIALPLGLMVALAPITGPFLAILLVVLAGLIIGGLLAKWGSQRLKAALKRPEDRK